MATFYLLPPRTCLDDAVAAFLGKLLPGLPAPAWDQLAQLVAPAGVYLVTRDELPEGEPAAEALATGFGAEPGDRVVEVALGGGARAWVLGGVSGAAAA